MPLNPRNGNIIIKFKKSFTELMTTSGIILPNVEQDMNVATVVAIPPDRKYWHKVYMPDGTPVRAANGLDIKEQWGEVTVNPGDKVLIERRTHAEYDSGPARFVIPHCVYMAPETHGYDDNDHDYYIIRFEDVLGTTEGNIRDNNVFGELYSIIPPKPIQTVNS